MTVFFISKHYFYIYTWYTDLSITKVSKDTSIAFCVLFHFQLIFLWFFLSAAQQLKLLQINTHHYLNSTGSTRARNMSVNGKLQFHLLTAWQKSNHTLVFDNLLSNANFFKPTLQILTFWFLKQWGFFWYTM